MTSLRVKLNEIIHKMVLILHHKNFIHRDVKWHKVETTLKLHLIDSSKTLSCLVNIDNFVP